mgnify:CR=1 FL=1
MKQKTWREDFDIYLQRFLEKIDDPQKRKQEEKSMRSRYESVVTREKEMGTWKVQGKPSILPSRRLPTDADIAAAVNEERERKEQMMGDLYKNAINNLLANPQQILASEIPPHKFQYYFPEKAEEILVKVKEKRRDEGMYKEIAFLGLFPKIAEVDAIVEYIDSLPEILSDADRKLLAACFFSLGMLAERGDGQAQNVLSKQAEDPSYWASRGINIYGNDEVPDDSLTSVNALMLASFLSYSFWKADHNSPEKVAEYLNYIGVQGAQRKIMEDALLIGAHEQVRFHDPNPETRSGVGWMFKWKVFDLILKTLTPPVTRERLITPSP